MYQEDALLNTRVNQHRPLLETTRKKYDPFWTKVQSGLLREEKLR